MRPFRRDRRALAEIVGTLMLVVIVVAAATAFSFFVAAYQKQLQAEETLTHDKSLENLRILALSPNASGSPPTLASLTVELASSDVNPTVVDGMSLNGYAVVNYTVVDFSGKNLSTTECLNGNPFLSTSASCVLDVPAETQVFLELNLVYDSPGYSFPTNVSVTLTESDTLNFELYTSLGNVFTQSFVPPVAIAQLSFVGSVTASNPILDGSSSYQPAGGSGENVTIDEWRWSVVQPGNETPCHTSGDCDTYSGQEYELPLPFSPDSTYFIYLNVTNSDSLVGEGYIQYASA